MRVFFIVLLFLITGCDTGRPEYEPYNTVQAKFDIGSTEDSVDQIISNNVQCTAFKIEYGVWLSAKHCFKTYNGNISFTKYDFVRVKNTLYNATYDVAIIFTKNDYMIPSLDLYEFGDINEYNFIVGHSIYTSEHIRYGNFIEYKDVIRVRIETFSGDSGSPIISCIEEECSVVGIFYANTEHSKYGLISVAVPSYDVIDWIYDNI